MACISGFTFLWNHFSMNFSNISFSVEPLSFTSVSGVCISAVALFSSSSSECSSHFSLHPTVASTLCRETPSFWGLRHIICGSSCFAAAAPRRRLFRRRSRRFVDSAEWGFLIWAHLFLTDFNEAHHHLPVILAILFLHVQFSRPVPLPFRSRQWVVLLGYSHVYVVGSRSSSAPDLPRYRARRMCSCHVLGDCFIFLTLRRLLYLARYWPFLTDMRLNKTLQLLIPRYFCTRWPCSESRVRSSGSANIFPKA